ncbi:Fanconi-associated nuclease 1 [Dufourea novaeangliae]|uniref:Fanconi-associated nuclease n=2 Tax=Dufourea novaeangliae TaxID=178035 RepID=A0A154P1R3_DUFNO|nr:Fanconi-associated nuclease 1 [Dufourea novaeangliae]
MNLIKQGAISPNEFNLEKIYSEDTFKYCYSEINTQTLMKYNLTRVTLPTDLNAKILIFSILTVMSEPINCGYFEEHELDFIYVILTLPERAQMLLARMIKRKRDWHRLRNINYSEIAADLKDTFELLQSRSICTCDVKKEDLSVILDLLQVDELRRLCQCMKIDVKGKKEASIKKLLMLSKNKSLFPGMRSPSTALYSSLFSILDYCVRVKEETWNIIDTIMTLLLPYQSGIMTMSDIFYMLGDVYLEKIIFPDVPNNRFPIFSSKIHLMNYVYARSTLFTTMSFIEKKNWRKVKIFGEMATNILPKMLETESIRLQNTTLPMHVRRFMPGYVWLKILSKTIDAFKKDADKSRVVKILHLLLNQECHTHTYKGRWYCELARIKMFHYKDSDTSALITIKALNTENLSRVDKVDLINRGNMILRRKTGVKSDTKVNIKKVLDDHICQMPRYEAASNIIDASAMPRTARGSKSVWCVESGTESQSYGSVEAFALYYYTENGFSNGLHCEGNLPILLFSTLFWEELYNEDIPGAFMTPYQDAPFDLYTEHFYENRKDTIDTKLQIISTVDAEYFSCFMEESYKTRSHYRSLMPSNFLKQNSHMKEIVYCLGVEGVVGICKRMLDNFKLWKAGFPDLIVWNYTTRQHKIVEVKGPRDVLSTKQRLWLEYLNELGLNTEVCLVQGRKDIVPS